MHTIEGGNEIIGRRAGAPRNPARRREAGGIMLVALLVLTAGTFGFAAWISLVTARSTYPESQEQSIRRRVTLSNSRAMASEYVLRRVLTESSAAAVELSVRHSADAADVWGRFTLAEMTEAPLTSTRLTAGMNRFSPSNNNYGYYVPLEVSLDDGQGLIESRFFAKSRSPLLSGDVLWVGRSAQAPDYAISVAADAGGSYLLADGRAFYGHPMATHSYGNRAKNYQTRDIGAALAFAPSTAAGSPAVLSNFPSVPQTAGRSGTDLGFTGIIDVIDNANNPQSLVNKVTANQYLSHQLIDAAKAATEFSERGVSCDGVVNGFGGATIDIDLTNYALNNILIRDGVTKLRIFGQDTPGELSVGTSLPAVMLVVAQGATNLREVEFHHQNTRRLVVAIKNPTFSYLNWFWMEANETVAPAERLEFRTILSLENVDMDFSFPGNFADVHFYGGFSLDRRVIIGGAAEKMTLHPELINPGTSNTAAFSERYAARVAWLETFVP